MAMVLQPPCSCTPILQPSWHNDKVPSRLLTTKMRLTNTTNMTNNSADTFDAGDASCSDVDYVDDAAQCHHDDYTRDDVDDPDAAIPAPCNNPIPRRIERQTVNLSRGNKAIK